MKNTVLSLILAVLLVLSFSACGNGGENISENGNEKIKESTENAETTVVNPVSVITENEAKADYPDLFRVPKEAKNVKWSRIMNPNSSAASVKPIIELRFDLDDRTFIARQEETGKTARFSHGLHYKWTASDPFKFVSKGGNSFSGTSYRYIGEGKYVDLSTWYDPVSQMSYSVSVSAENLDGFDLQAIVEAIAP